MIVTNWLDFRRYRARHHFPRRRRRRSARLLYHKHIERIYKIYETTSRRLPRHTDLHLVQFIPQRLELGRLIGRRILRLLRRRCNFVLWHHRTLQARFKCGALRHINILTQFLETFLSKTHLRRLTDALLRRSGIRNLSPALGRFVRRISVLHSLAVADIYEIRDR